jgi:3-deoxy-D-manno-octulosonate 8-phosphate phosphatase (KDO 8-P phosphatase)
LNNIQLIIYDFDGVLTDNKVILREDGLESVIVNRSDGLAVDIIRRIGIKQVIITKEKNKVVEARANKLGIPVIKGVDNKKEILISYCNENNIQLDNVVYIGNDINDLEAMMVVGYAVCPSDAYEEVKKISKIILDVRGGDGVVRKFLTYIDEYIGGTYL